MITQMSKKVSSFFVDNGIVKEEDKDIYNFSLEVLLSTAINLIAILIIGILSRKIVETTFFLLGFIPLRRVAGGYHARTHFRCFLILILTYLIFLGFIIFIPNTIMVEITVAFLIASINLIYLLSPVENKNKPLSLEEAAFYRKKSKKCIKICSFIIILLVVILKNKTYALSMVMGVLAVSLSLIVSEIKNM